MRVNSEERKAYGKVVKRGPNHTAHIQSDEEKHAERVKNLLEKRATLSSTPDKLAGNKLFFRNWMYPQGKQTFPNQPDLWYVHRYYPMADGGPLAFDTPETDHEKELAELKKPALKKAGIRYYVIDRSKTLEVMFFEVGAPL